ncbi:MATE family efflux transporter [Acutalibacter sp. 1XD8-33]|uniref:MATE family efflux transporter n=1 Tax=Acutalibacter sp. 1XD8-33 TaxID=2320081 RepID=UPI000EA3B464|nr:MATE family efflux transporter [Acutalibacter sp. 1XD8-33]RKJ39212.1 MATE family efflux transporter [Acutalibacter sp. 1XD8-33]
MTKESRIDKYWVRDKTFYHKVLMILIPIVLQSIINQGVNMMDTIMVGKLGEASISASSLANQFYNIFVFLCMGISAAGLVLSSQYFGAGDLKTVRRVFDLVLQIVIAGGAAFAIATFLLPAQIMRIFTVEEDVIQLGAQYLRVTALVYLPHGISLVLSNVMRSIGNAKLGLYVSIASFIINIGANYIFIFGKLGAPALGVMGAAVGTLIARGVEFLFCAVYLLKYEKILRYQVRGLLKAPTKELFGEFRRLGLPAIISDSLLALAASAISIILGHMGKEVVSAYAIVTVMDRMATVAIQGVSSASGVIIGQTVGEGEFDRAQKEGWTFLILSVLIGILGGILVLVLGEWSVALYEIAPSTIKITISMMEASAIIVFFQAIQSALSKGILRGGGDTKFLMVADIIFQWVASVPLGALAGLVLGLPPALVLIALRIDFIIKSVWLVFRLKSGKWIHKAKSMEEREPDRS